MVHFDLLPDGDAAEWLAQLRNRRGVAPTFARALAEHLPQRLADAWAHAHAPRRGCEASGAVDARGLDAVAAQLKHWSLRPSGTLGYKSGSDTRRS